MRSPLENSLGPQAVVSPTVKRLTLEPTNGANSTDSQGLGVGEIISTSAGGVANEWLIWQLADSAFPSGGFAHSSGLEAAVQQGELRNERELGDFIKSSLKQFGHASLPFMLAAFDSPESLTQLDRLCDCFTSNHVANRASRLQGRALFASAGRIFPSAGLQELGGAGSESVGHLAPTCGAILRKLGLERITAARLFLFFHLRGLISAAVRLGLVGPLQGQALHHRLAPEAEELLRSYQDLTVNEVAQTAPLLDLWQANQDCLYSRLFQS